MKHAICARATAALISAAALALSVSNTTSAQQTVRHDEPEMLPHMPGRRCGPIPTGNHLGAPTVVYQNTIRGGCVSGSTCITFDGANGPDGGTITFPPSPADALPIFGYLYFQYLTTTDCSVDRIGDFASATVNGVNINTLPFVEIACLNADSCFPADVATHFYRVDVSTLFDFCDLNIATFELRNFGSENSIDSDWVEGATLMVAYCSESSPATDIVLIENAQVFGEGVDATPSITYSWAGFNASGGNATLVLGIGNGQNFTGTFGGDELVSFSTNSTPITVLGDTGTDGLFDGDLCAPGPFGNGGLYDNSIIDVTGLVNAGDSSATFSITGEFDCLDSNAAFLCVASLNEPNNCVPDACQDIGCFTLDAQTDDDGQPLVHGQHLGNGDTEFDGGPGFPVTLTSSSGTAAVLDSNVGPASQDPDLLVGRGNILILQNDANLNECPPASGVYCTHNDDEDGGTFSFAFPGSITADSLVLIDIDASDPTSTVTLTDGSGAQRTYSVPANWTGDLVTDGPPGWGTLDLTTLASQPGFGSNATASEDAGFDAEDVLQIDVTLGGSGAIDNLSWCESAGKFTRASASLRPGSGVNPSSLRLTALPVIGRTFGATLDCAGLGGGMAVLDVRRDLDPGRLTVFGEALIQGSLVHRSLQARFDAPNELTWDVPNDVALCGLAVHAQGLCMSQSAGGPHLHGLDGRLSNAIDLVVGF